MIRRALDRLRDFLPMLGFRRAVAPIIPPQLLEEIAATEARRKFALADAKLSPLERLIHWWGDDAQPGATDEDMQALEQKYAIRLPGDFRAYLMATMPKGNDWDAEGTNWWALGDLKSVREERADWDAGKCPAGDDKMIVFADFMIRGFAWAVDCSEGENRGSIVLLTGDENPCIADSFDQFLDRYLLDVLSVM